MILGTSATPTPNRYRHRGFTLVELLVGLTLLAVITLVLYSAFWLSLRSWEAAATHREQAEDMRLAVGFLQRYLSKAYPLLLREDTAHRLQFEGTERRLRFVTDMAPHLGTGGLHAFVVEFTENSDGGSLVVTRTLLHPDLDPMEAAQFTQRAVLARRIGEARFAYFGALSDDRAAQGDLPERWHAHWTDARRLPKLVSLAVTPDAAQPWPELVVALHIDEVRRDASSARSPDRLGRDLPAKGDGVS
ncbi:MAG: prepilin-type N-terminal cleavage/methylation domain-containing protein [Gammaproteobacteria bacterium]